MPTLTYANAHLAEDGPIVPATLLLPRAQSVGDGFPLNALIDTGASFSALRPGLAAQLGLHPKGVRYTASATHSEIPAAIFRARIVLGGLPVGGGGPLAVDLDFCELDLPVFGIHCLLGRNFLSLGSFTYDGKNKTFAFTY